MASLNESRVRGSLRPSARSGTTCAGRPAGRPANSRDDLDPGEARGDEAPGARVHSSSTVLVLSIVLVVLGARSSPACSTNCLSRTTGSVP